MADWHKHLKLPVAAAVLLAGAVLWTLVYWSIVVLLGPEHPRVHTWKADVQFVFSGVERGQYPNGMAFAASDLLSPVVIERALAALDDLPAGLDSERVAGKLSVSAWFPGLNELRTRYRARLDGDLSIAELNELQAAYVQEFERGARSRARLFFTSTDQNVPAEAILKALPEAWERYMHQEYGVFTSNRELVSMDALAVGAAGKEDFLLAYLRLREQLTLLGRNIAALEAEPNSGGVRDNQSGLRLADVRARAAQLEDLVLENYLNQVLEVGLRQNPGQMRQFMTARIQALQRRVSVLDDQAQAVTDALREYGAAGLTMRSSAADGPFLLGGGQDFLNRLIRLGAEGGDAEFRQDLTRQRLAIDAESARLGSEIARLQQLIRSEEWTDHLLPEAADANGALGGPDLESLLTAISRVEETVNTLFGVLDNIAERLDELRFGAEGRMFNLSGLSPDPEWSSGLVSQGSLRWYVRSLVTFLLALGVLMLVIFAVSGRTRSGV